MSWINSLEYKLCQPLTEYDRWFESTDTLDRIWSNYTETHRCLQILVPRRMSESENHVLSTGTPNKGCISLMQSDLSMSIFQAMYLLLLLSKLLYLTR